MRCGSDRTTQSGAAGWRACGRNRHCTARRGSTHMRRCDPIEIAAGDGILVALMRGWILADGDGERVQVVAIIESGLLDELAVVRLLPALCPGQGIQKPGAAHGFEIHVHQQRIAGGQKRGHLRRGGARGVRATDKRRREQLRTTGSAQQRAATDVGDNARSQVTPSRRLLSPAILSTTSDTAAVPASCRRTVSG